MILLALLSGCAATTSRTGDDLTTTTEVKIALLNDAQVGGLRLDVKTFQGVVTLSGTVKSQAQADQAVSVAKRIRGVRAVTPALKVEGASYQSSVRMQLRGRPSDTSASGTSATIAGGPHT